jgi:hypothetical protein
MDRGEGGDSARFWGSGPVLQRTTSPEQRSFMVPLVNAVSAAYEAGIFIPPLGPPAAGSGDLLF